jgi:hypothetical protein
LKEGPKEPPKDFYATFAWAPKKLLVCSDDSCLLVHPETGEQTKYPLPSEVRKEAIAACHLPDGILLLVSNGFASGRRAQRVMWIKPGGQVLRNKDIQLAQLGGENIGEATAAGVAALAVPLLSVYAPMVCLIPLSPLQSERFDTYWAGLGEAIGYCWPALLALAVLGGIAAVAAYRRQKRFGLRGAFGWGVFAFLFGVPGWISYRLHRTWPVLEECPACQQSAPRDRDVCIECGADFPPPAPKGIEVFA